MVTGVRSVPPSGKFYWLLPDKENMGKGGPGGGSRPKDNRQVIYTVSPNKVYGLKYFASGCTCSLALLCSPIFY